MSTAQQDDIERLMKAAEILIDKNDAANEKNRQLIEQCESYERQRDEALEKLRSLNHGDLSEAWHWMGDGNDNPESLVAPILISANDLRMIIGERDAALEREQALAREASYHQQEIDSLLGRLRKTQTERDVHMAHSARVNEVLFKTFSAIEDGNESALPYDEYRDAFNDAPTASLTHRDLIKQAEALEEAQSELYEFPASAGMAMVEHVGGKAADLRQRAQLLK